MQAAGQMPRVADPALRFYYGVVTRYRNELERAEALHVWKTYIVRELDAYMGLVFESIAEQAYTPYEVPRVFRRFENGGVGWGAIKQMQTTGAAVVGWSQEDLYDGS
jgi:hypothetical protein